jgi:hypothetical protein
MNDTADNGVLATMTDVSAQRKLEQARLTHAQEREVIAQKQADDAEQRRKDADERRRGQGTVCPLPFPTDASLPLRYVSFVSLCS